MLTQTKIVFQDEIAALIVDEFGDDGSDIYGPGGFPVQRRTQLTVEELESKKKVYINAGAEFTLKLWTKTISRTLT